MNKIDIEPEEDSNDLPPPMAAAEGQESSRSSVQDAERNTRKLTPKVRNCYQ